MFLSRVVFFFLNSWLSQKWESKWNDEFKETVKLRNDTILQKTSSFMFSIFSLDGNGMISKIGNNNNN